jgi:DNA helicase HerA-like ATPase
MDGAQMKLEAKLGRVITVSGAQVIMLLDDASGDGGQAAAPLQIGALVKMPTLVSTVFGIVAGLNVPMPAQHANDVELRLVEVELIGETENSEEADARRFQRGVSTFPTLGDGVYAATAEDLSLVYAPRSRAAVRIGTVHQDRSLPAYIVADDLLGKHFAVLGSTGTGKSCAVALILRAMMHNYRHGHIVLLDMHNEYARAFGDNALVLDPGKLDLPYWLFNFEEFEEVVLGGSRDRQVEGAILSELIKSAKRLSSGNSDKTESIKQDTPVPYRMGELTRLLDEAAGKLDKAPDVSPYMRLKARLQALQSDTRFSFMFPGVAVRDNMVDILSTLFRIPVNGKPVTIIDLSSVPSEVLNVVVSVLCRMTFDFALWSERAVPILLICEEAHRYCPVETKSGFEPAKRALSRIAKEGRKYGVSLCLVSQRPSELSASILSQCNTIFALRMSHQSDQEFVRGALPEAAGALLDFLPALRNAEAIAIGEGVPVPIRLCFDELAEEFRPHSGTASFSAAWTEETKNTAFLKTVVERWRRQRHVA